MRPLSLALIALLSCHSRPASAQTVPPGAFQHIIIVVQENRTPDNIFGAWAAGGPCALSSPFAGADINNGGYTIHNNQRLQICNTSLAMNAQPANGVFDPGHEYEDWTTDYHNGFMDGFCNLNTIYVNCPKAPNPSPYSYIQPSDVQPYFALASTYGFANYMFQTNQGPSFPAHQFLFTGTSAPVAPNDPQGFYWDFVRDNPPRSSEFDTSGCPYNKVSQYPFAPWVQPDRTLIDHPTLPECYTHDTLVTSSDCSHGLCDKGITWRYYSPTPSGIIWNAPEALPEVCYGENDLKFLGRDCGTVNGGNEWNDHMSFYSAMNDAPIFNDINSCQLQQISWVMPDLVWSDHPFSTTSGPALGPFWVGNIVNAIGNSYLNSGGKCDYWGTSSATPEPTAIFIVWDDWGGFYDHVPPPKNLTGAPDGNSWKCPAPATNNWGCGYTYGFRVPLLVVSEFTGTLSDGEYTGYVSGACGSSGNPSCPNANYPYVHDFGSILAFAEYNFGLSNIDQSGNLGYADYNALDWDVMHLIAPLSDFFSLYTTSDATGRPFIEIPVSLYPASFFQHYYATHHAIPTGPDTD